MTDSGRDAGESTGRLPGPPPVAVTLEWAILLLTARAWQSMGLVVNPETGETERDLGETRRAIDAIEALAALVGSDRAAELKPLLADLRLNYVRQAGETAPGGGAG